MNVQDIWPAALAIAAVITGIALAITGFADRDKRNDRPNKTCRECMAPTLERLSDRIDRIASRLGEMHVFFEGTTKAQIGHLEEIHRLCVDILRNGRKRD